MKRFLVFKINNWEANGGMTDFHSDHDTLDNAFAFFLGKSARTTIHDFSASFLKACDCQMVLSNLIQGAHQSEPEKTIIMFLSCSEACFLASSKL